MNSRLSARATLRAAVASFFFSVGLTFASWASRIPDIKAALGLSDAALGTLLLAMPAGQLLLIPVAGRVVARVGSARMLGIVSLLSALLLMMVGVITQVWLLVLVLALFGMTGALMNIATNAQAMEVEMLYHRPIMASFHGAWSLAGVSGAGIGMLMRAYDIAPFMHFAIVAVPVLINLLISPRYLSAAEPLPAPRGPLFKKPHPVLLRLGIIGFCGLAAEGTMFDWSGVYFQQIVQPPQHLVLLGYASFMTCMALGRFVGDGITHRLGHRHMLQLNGLLIAGGLSLAALFPNLATATLGFMITGFGVATVIPTLYSSAARSGAARAEMAIASVSGIAFMGFLAAPPLMGYIAQAASLRVSLGVIALMGLSITLLSRRGGQHAWQPPRAQQAAS